MQSKEVARPAGFEPATYGFVVRHSIQLSYGRATGFNCQERRPSLSIEAACGGWSAFCAAELMSFRLVGAARPKIGHMFKCVLFITLPNAVLSTPGLGHFVVL